MAEDAASGRHFFRSASGTLPPSVDETRERADSTAEVYNVAAAQSSLAVAAAAEREKHQSYDALARGQGAEFYAFAIETFGAFGNDARKLVQKIANVSQAVECQWTYNEMLAGMVNAVSVAVQRGNGLMISAGLSRARMYGRSRQLAGIRN